MGLKNLYDAKPVAIHILGQPAEGDLKRPFKAGGFLGGVSFPPSCFVVGHQALFFQLLQARRQTKPQSTRRRSVLLRRTSRLSAALSCLTKRHPSVARLVWLSLLGTLCNAI